MKDLNQLRSDQEYALRRAEEIMATANEEDRILTDKEKAQHTELMAEADGIAVEIEQRKEHQRIEDDLKKRRADTDTPVVRKTEPIRFPLIQEPKIEFPVRNAAKLKCFKGKDAARDAFMFGLWLNANINGNDSAKRKLRDLGQNERALSETTNTAGGALVPVELADHIINLREEYGVFQNEALSWPMSSDVTEMPRINGRMAAAFFGEGATFSTSDLEFGSITLVAKKAGILTYVSNELSEDAMVSVGDLIGNEMGHEFAEQIDDSGFNGDGSATYAGILGVANRIEAATGATAYVNATSGTDTFGEIDAEDLGRVKAAVSNAAHKRGNAKWYCSRACHELVFARLQMSAGGNTRRETADGSILSYDGNDVIISEVLETSTGTVNNTAFLLFGDLEQAAVFGNRRTLSIATSDQFRFANDQTAIRAVHRFDVQTVPEIEGTGITPLAALIGNS